MLYFISGTPNTVLFGQAPPKPYQNHPLDTISLLIDGSGSGLLKSGSGSAKKPGSIRIRIRNTEKMTDTVPPRWFYFASVDCLLCYFTAHRGIRFLLRYFICTVLTVRSAAPQTALVLTNVDIITVLPPCPSRPAGSHPQLRAA